MRAKFCPAFACPAGSQDFQSASVEFDPGRHAMLLVANPIAQSKFTVN